MERRWLGIISNVVTPYRIHLHRRVTAEIPEFRLASYFTHARGDFNWQVASLNEINPVFLASDFAHTRTAGSWRSIRRELRIGDQIAKELEKRPTAALIVNGYNDLTRLRLFSVCRKRGIPVFLRADSNILGDSPGKLKSWFKRRLLKRVFRSVSGFMPMGELGVQYFVKYGADSNRCFLVPYEPDYDYFRQTGQDAVEKFVRRHRLPDGRKRFLFCGRLIAVKRVDLLLSAFQQLSSELAQWDLVIVGDGPLHEVLRNQVDPSLAKRIHWLGFLDVDNTRLAYHACDILVLTSDYEPWAVVINEALACGLAVVASHVCGAAHELLADNVAGRRFRAGERDDLVIKMRELSNPTELVRAKLAAPKALERWRRRADPVAGIRHALMAVGALPDVKAASGEIF